MVHPVHKNLCAHILGLSYASEESVFLIFIGGVPGIGKTQLGYGLFLLQVCFC